MEIDLENFEMGHCGLCDRPNLAIYFRKIRRKMLLKEALNLARNIKYGPLPKENDPYPSINESIKLIENYWMRKEFTWLTGREALEILKVERNKI